MSAITKQEIIEMIENAGAVDGVRYDQSCVTIIDPPMTVGRYIWHDGDGAKRALFVLEVECAGGTNEEIEWAIDDSEDDWPFSLLGKPIVYVDNFKDLFAEASQ